MRDPRTVGRRRTDSRMMTDVHAWVLVHAAATWAMVGFIWTIQLLVYPMMAKVPGDAFPAFEQFHQRRVVVVLAGFAIVEVVAAAALAVVDTGVPRPLSLAGGVLLVAIWVSTGAFYAPLHGRLGAGYDPAVHALLVTTNWFRTVGWTIRGVVALLALIAVAD